MTKEKKEELIMGKDGKMRCWWHGNDPFYLTYHDEEWGRPCKDDIRLFEKLCLEGFQAGLSWLTILRKRENFRKAFQGFDFEKVALFTENDVKKLLKDAGIIRHEGKIRAAINNARKVPEIISEFGSLAAYFWQYEPHKITKPKKHKEDIPALSEESTALSKDLKKRGFAFVGPTTVYAHMQSMGLVNDHLQGCYCFEIVEEERKKFIRP